MAAVGYSAHMVALWRETARLGVREQFAQGLAVLPYNNGTQEEARPL